MKTLEILEQLSIPIDAVTQKMAWLGRTGSGKTYGCKRFVEQALRAGAQVVVLDSMGVWYGLRQGEGGFPIPVLGGLYGDIPLDPGAGVAVAEFVVAQTVSLVLDVSQMTDGQRAKFAEAFGRRLFELKKASPSAMHLVLDEAQDFVPQNANDGEKMMLHEYVRICKQGRALGMGVSMVSQRPQEVNKKALNQVECVMAFQLTGPHERKALEYWLADKGMETKLSKVLTTLPVGEPFVWSPQWLKVSSVQGKVLPISSSDTSRTPQVGDAPRAQQSMKKIDLVALRKSLEASVVEATENDPKALKAELRALRQQLAEATERKPEGISWQQLQTITTELRGYVDRVADCTRDVSEHLEQLKHHVLELGEYEPSIPDVGPPSVDRFPKEMLQKPVSSLVTKDLPPLVKLERVDRMLLQVLSTHGGMKLEKLALLAGYPVRASTTKNSAIKLRSLGYITGKNTERIDITALGRGKVGAVEPLPKGPKALLEYWCGRLEKVDREILTVLSKRKKPMLFNELAIAARYDPAKSTAKNSVIKLRSLGLIAGKNTDGITINESLAQ